MTYFELFGIPVSLRVDPAKLQTRFFELSRKYHPDFFSNAGTEAQADSLEKSALLNKAWKTFQDPDATIQYVLKSKGILEEDEKYELPAAFLMEVLEINEELMDMNDSRGDELLNRTKEIENGIYAQVQPIIENYDDETVSEKELLQVKAYYYKKKYLDRIKKQILSLS